MSAQPPPIPTLQPMVPPLLDRLVARCLAKDPDGRFQSAGDLAFNLQSLASPSSAAPVPGVETHWFRAGRWLTVAGLVAGVAVSAFLAGNWLSVRRSDSDRVPHVEVRQMTFQPALGLAPSLSPDGQSFVFAADYTGNFDIYLQRADGQNPFNLTKDCDKNDCDPAFSPTGDRIAYRSECGGGGIFVMGATGESARRLTDFGVDPAWSPDGREIVEGLSVKRLTEPSVTIGVPALGPGSIG